MCKKETKFKVGDKVKMSSKSIYCGKIGTISSVRNDGNVYISGLSNMDEVYGKDAYNYFALIKKDWDNLEVGDILEKPSNTSIIIHAIIDDVIIVKFVIGGSLFQVLIENYKTSGYTIRGSTKEVQEMTLADVCKELGRDIKIVKS